MRTVPDFLACSLTPPPHTHTHTHTHPLTHTHTYEPKQCPPRRVKLKQNAFFFSLLSFLEETKRNPTWCYAFCESPISTYEILARFSRNLVWNLIPPEIHALQSHFVFYFLYYYFYYYCYYYYCYLLLLFFLLRRCDPTQVMASSFLRFIDHTQRRTTVGRTPLDEWSARRRDFYLTTHNTHNWQISMSRWDSNQRSQ